MIPIAAAAAGTAVLVRFPNAARAAGTVVVSRVINTGNSIFDAVLKIISGIGMFALHTFWPVSKAASIFGALWLFFGAWKQRFQNRS